MSRRAVEGTAFPALLYELLQDRTPGAIGPRIFQTKKNSFNPPFSAFLHFFRFPAQIFQVAITSFYGIGFA